ncbi:hypothetical protein SLEP1_g54154 [Rubroshorea leprosula]|uniref:DUF4220 domain-containing protein n=1 Tax=Rubroshorea leprosula TaxID=152421 RepID=A0AAV5MBP6_9ROSI|nr:hypothetical protein SLEP1_g54154 [Rubroshorea leprosula]
MLGPPVVESVMKLWSTWNIRGLIILSLLVQSLLILFAPLRRQRGNKWIVVSIWLTYLLADWVATFTIGLMGRAEVSDILAFWATFLLLHLGGPDTITSFSLEDNELWLRHLPGLMLQIGSTVYVILQSLPGKKLWLPTLLVLIAGIIKYAERSYAFYLASFDHFKEPATGIIKNLLVGPLVHAQVRYTNREVIKERGSKEVLLKLETELSLLYEALHTKLPVVCCKIGYVFRAISFGCILGALLSFGLILNHYHQLGKFEIWLTYGLLIGARTLDFTSIGFLIFSDFNLALGKIPIPEWKIVAWIKNKRRWSRRIPQCNFITCFVDDRPYWLNKLADFFHIRNVLDAIKLSRYLSSRDFTEEVWHFILEEMKRKAAFAATVEQGIKISSKRGDGILDSNNEHRRLIWSVKDLDYSKSLLTWHFATDLCFHDEDDSPPSNNMDGNLINYKAISKLLSDYMLYLMEMQPGMMSTVSLDWKDVHKQSCDDVRRFFNSPSRLDGKYFSRAILQLGPDSRDFLFKFPFYRGAKRYPILHYHANKLAHQLKGFHGGSHGIPWKLMSQVWVEIMCYAAINCKPNVHAQQPSKGGELITLVWLLMNHLGIGTQFASPETKSEDIISADDTNADDVRLEVTSDDFRAGHERNRFKNAALLVMQQRQRQRQQANIEKSQNLI